MKDELTDEQLELVVGGARDMKIFITRGNAGTNNKTLDTDLWMADKIKPKVRSALLKIAERFIEKTKAKDIEVKDIVITGSLANYNYSKYSDIDLHIIVDFKDVDDNYDLVKNYFDATKALWNYLHDIFIKNHEVEIYVQDENEEHHSTGVYSLLDDEWVTKPVYKKSSYDKDSVEKKAASLIDQIERALSVMENGNPEEALERSEVIGDKIKRMRQNGLRSRGEYSVENMAFKELRNDGYLKKLSDLKRESYDTLMSLDEKKKSKGDRCTRIAKRKYDVWPSAYASGAVVKCRQGKIWKGVKEDLKKWFGRRGEKGSKGGWVDCNAPDGDGGYRECAQGERKKKPACRPTPSACKDAGKGKKWGKKSEDMEVKLTLETIRKMISEEVSAYLKEQEYYEVDALSENEEYCPVCASLEEKKKKACKPSKGKRFAKRVDGKCRSFGQSGQAKSGGDRIRPGTKKGDAYCARSAGIKKCKNPPCANTLSRKKWKCRGKKSVAESTD
ncbi:MAG TPA: hypothetical protein DCX14_08435 [Flavobacteriales bacterium]|nr:hypothetical protein [Flavobacteriales bacterium]